MRRPVAVVLAGMLGLTYALVLCGVGALLLWQLVTGTGAIGHQHPQGASLKGVLFTSSTLFVVAASLASGGVQLLRDRGLSRRRGLLRLVLPLLLFLVVGCVGETVDLFGDASAASDVIGAAILLAAVVPVLLVRTPGARRWAASPPRAAMPH